MHSQLLPWLCVCECATFDLDLAANDDASPFALGVASKHFTPISRNYRSHLGAVKPAFKPQCGLLLLKELPLSFSLNSTLPLSTLNSTLLLLLLPLLLAASLCLSNGATTSSSTTSSSCFRLPVCGLEPLLPFALTPVTARFHLA
jgi:hypothetical protein